MGLIQEKEKDIWRGAFILTIAALVTKVLSAGYRIPYQNIAGDIGFYIYQQVYPFYGVALIVSTYGFPVIISKLVAEYHDQDNESKLLGIIFLTLCLISVLIFSLLYAGAEFIARSMGDNQLYIPLKVVAFSYLFIPFISTFRGYFQGHKNMIPTAISQVGEQFVRVATILLFSSILLTSGYSIYQAGAGAVFGSITGGFVAVVILMVYWKRQKRKMIHVKHSLQIKKIVSTLLIHGLLICISNLFLVLLQLIDAMTILSLLSKNHFIELSDAKAAKGIFDRGQPLIQLGTVIATSLSLALVPLISSAKLRHDFDFIKAKVSLSLRVSIVIGMGAAIGLMNIISPTNVMLFTNSDGSVVLAVLSLSILFSSVAMTSAGILQGLDKTVATALHVFYGVGIKLILNVVLVPAFSTLGAALATVIAFAAVAILNVRLIQKELNTFFIKPLMVKMILVSAMLMSLGLFSFQAVIGLIVQAEAESRLFSTFQALSGVAVGGYIYMFFIIRQQIFSQEELTLIPLGDKLNRFVKRRKIG